MDQRSFLALWGVSAILIAAGIIVRLLPSEFGEDRAVPIQKGTTAISSPQKEALAFQDNAAAMDNLLRRSAFDTARRPFPTASEENAAPVVPVQPPLRLTLVGLRHRPEGHVAFVKRSDTNDILILETGLDIPFGTVKNITKHSVTLEKEGVETSLDLYKDNAMTVER